jgi:hypothetical protein
MVLRVGTLRGARLHASTPSRDTELRDEEDSLRLTEASVWRRSWRAVFILWQASLLDGRDHNLPESGGAEGGGRRCALIRI